MDEAGHVDEDFTFDVVIPMLSVKHSSIVFISSENKDASNWFSRVMRMKDENGEYLFKSVRFEHSNTREYKEHEEKDISEHSKSTFREGMNAKHKSDESRRRWDIVYNETGRSAANMVENYGVQASGLVRVFDDELLSASAHMFENRCSDAPSKCGELIVSIDPSYTGGNATAISIAYRSGFDNVKMYLWLDDMITRTSSEMLDFVCSSLSAFRSKFADYASKTMRIYIETNSSSAGSYIHNKLTAEQDPIYGKVAPINFEKTKGEIGVFKTTKTSSDYIKNTTDMLVYKKLAFSKRLGCTNLKGSTGIMNELKKALERYYYKNAEKKTCPTGKGKEGENDDILIVFMMACHFAQNH